MNKKKILWLLVGLPLLLFSLLPIRNLYYFNQYTKIGHTLDCDAIFEEKVWEKDNYICFSPQTAQGSIWTLAIIVLVLTQMFRYTRKNLQNEST